MPAGVEITSVPDLINHSLAHFRAKPSFQAVFDYQNYDVVDELFVDGRYRVQDGNRIEWRIVFKKNGSFRFVNIGEVTPRNWIDVQSRGFANWSLAEAKVNYEARILSMMKGESELVDELKAQYFAGVQDALDGIELSAVQTKADATDTKTPDGFNWWFCMLNSGVVNANGTFAGILPRYNDGTQVGDASLRGGLNGTTEAKWRNWAATRNGPLGMGTLNTIARGLVFTGQRPPRDIKQYYNPKRPKLRIYTDLTDELAYEELTNLGPESKNGDLRRFKGEGGLEFRGVEWRGLAVKEGQLYRPINVINFANFFVFTKEGWFNRKTDPMNDVDQPHLYTVQLDFQYGFACENVRNGGFVIHDPIP